MMTGDRDLEELFRARASTLPEPPPELFTRTMERIATPPRRANPIVAYWQRLGQRTELVFAVTAALLVTTFGLGQLLHAYSPGYGGTSERIATIKLDRMPTPPAAALGTPEFAADRDAAIARTASIALLVRDVPAALTALDTVARANGGLVTAINDSLPTDPGDAHTATLTLIVDARRLDAALTSIGTLGAQQARTATAQAIGDSIVDDRARLRNLRREETDLLHIMDRSGSVASILDVESKLADVRGEIEHLDAEVAEMQHRVATSQIDVTLTQAGLTVAPATPTLADHFAGTWHAALRSVVAGLTSILDAALWLVAFAPFWIVAALVALAIVLRLRSRF